MIFFTKKDTVIAFIIFCRVSMYGTVDVEPSTPLSHKNRFKMNSS